MKDEDITSKLLRRYTVNPKSFNWPLSSTAPSVSSNGCELNGFAHGTSIMKRSLDITVGLFFLILPQPFVCRNCVTGVD